MNAGPLLALYLIQLTGPDHQIIRINPAEVSNIRTPRGSDHFAPGTRCLVFMTDGRPITVMETCDEVRELLEDGKQ